FKRDQLANKEQVAIDDQDDDTEVKDLKPGRRLIYPFIMDVYTFGSTSGDAPASTTTPHSTSTTITSYTPTSTSVNKLKIIFLSIGHLKKSELLRNDEEVNLNARDVDTDEIYVMKLRWRGNHNNFIGKWGKIVRRKGLKAGKEIKIRWANGSLNFSIPYEPVVQTSMAVMMSHHHDELPIRKVLMLSDVDINHPFLALP
ncbi:B3 DNA binding domain-containing protein, partial [Tanacetum coccineum]